MFRTNLVIVTAIAVLTVSIWAFFNRPEAEPHWPNKIQGFSFSPFRYDQDPIAGRFPSVEQIDADLALLSGKANAVRTYTVDPPMDMVPELARKHGLNVAAGVWIGNDRERNKREIKRLIELVRKNRNIVRVLIGNEVVLRNEIPLSELLEYIDAVRKILWIPVGTAEPWHVWKKNPVLAEHVDFLGVHMLPFWEGVPLKFAVDYVVERINDLKAVFPEQPIVIAEVGWPSEGRTRRSAVASPANEATFLRRFLHRASRENYIYYVMEAFDQPWKHQTEGAVGAYWGVWDVRRQAKFTFSEPIVKIPEWRTLAVISVAVAAIALAMLLTDNQTLNVRGRSFLAVVAFAMATVSVWATYDYIHRYLTLSTILVGFLIVSGMIGVAVVFLTEAHEWAEALWISKRRRPFQPVQAEKDSFPMVSVHVPTYNEPPQMVIETLDALSRLDYPHFEVIVADNNTKDPAVWEPVAGHCRRLGSHFRFFHVDPLPGFKAGALNFALRRTDPTAQIIGVIDCDYVVDTQWLKDLVPQFQRMPVAIVQAPQDYRDENESTFKSMCYAEYRGFFFIGMITRNERNAIIQHGTMTLVRRSALEEAGGWSEWCITEDAELGLRIFEKGHEAVYVPRSYGRGLMPDTFIDYKKQRFRWAYGAVQIMRRHLGTLTGFSRSRLTAGQRYHFWAGWLPWMSDALNLLFNLSALGWSMAMAYAPKKFDPPMIVFSVFPLTLFCFKVAKLVYLYRSAHIVASVRQTLAAALAGLALAHTIAKAMLTGLWTNRKPFFRTPKMADSHALLKALAACREETLFMIVLWMAAASVAYVHRENSSTDLLLWTVVLLMQSLPYGAALAASLISAMPADRTRGVQRFRDSRVQGSEEGPG